MPDTSTTDATAGDVAVDRRAGLVLAVILTSQLMVVLDAAIVNVALPDIQTSLHFSAGNLAWVLNAYTLTLGGLLLLGARIGDIFGRRRTFLVGVAVFAAASLAGGLAPNPAALIVARAVQGAAGALAAPSSLALLTTAYPDGERRTRAIGLYTLVSIAGSSVGLVLGGVLTSAASWRWVMFVNVPLAAAALAVGGRVLPPTARSRRPFDLLGALTSTAGVGALAYAFIRAGEHGWADPTAAALLPVSVVALGAFILVERRAADPITPMRLLIAGSPSRANLARALNFAATAALLFFLSQYAQQVLGWGPLRTGIAFLPATLSVLVATQLVARRLYSRVPSRPLTLVGLVLVGAGLLVLTRVNPETGYSTLLAALVLYGLGTGVAVVTLTQAVLAGVAPADAGAASGLANVYQQLGATLGVAVLETVYATALRDGQGTQQHVLSVAADRVFYGAVIAVALAILLAATVPSAHRRAAS